MAWIDQYRKAIEQAAWVAGVSEVVARQEVIDGKEDLPLLLASFPVKSERDSVSKTFRESLVNSLGKDQPFMVSVCPPNPPKSYIRLYKTGAWQL